MGKFIDLTGERFGRLVVLQRVENIGGRTAWLCQCDCGNTIKVKGNSLKTGNTKSCGCLHKQLVASINFIDLTGKRFGKLEALKYEGDSTWLCKCDCGNMTKVKTQSLTHGKIQSCGCYRKEQITKKLVNNLLNQRFGKLTVIQFAGSKDGKAQWLCQCDCGNKRIVLGHSLVSGNTKSCGCSRSRGEDKISELLREANIPFEREKTFEDCVKIKKLRFDFYVNNQYLIEYDGRQHFDFTNEDWNTQERFNQTKERDAIKNQYCKDNNISLIRIPYTHLNKLTLNDLLLETSNFII